jgi:hypothetical protein
MERELQIKEYWKDVAEQNADRLKNYFAPSALIRWHNIENDKITILDEY